MIIYVLEVIKEPPRNIDKLTKDGDSHKKIADAMAEEIGSARERASFYNGIDYLKRARVQADYRVNKQFSQEECLEIRQRAEDLKNKITSYIN